MFKAFLYHTYLDFLSIIRIRIAAFFSIVFPIMLFFIFSSIWGSNNGYVFFILTGIVCLMTISEGLFSVGPVVRDYYSSGMFKYIKQFPLDISFFFLTFLTSKLFFFQFVIFLMALAAYFIFDTYVFDSYLEIGIGSILGFILFSLLGLCLSFLSKSSPGRTLSNVIYFLLIFISDIFYSISSSNGIINKVNSFLPVNDIVYLMRGEEYRLYVILIWLLVLIVLFRFLFNKAQIKR